MPAVLVAGPTCYAELAVSSPAVAETIASTHLPSRDGQVEWVSTWVSRINTGMIHRPKVFVTNLST